MGLGFFVPKERILDFEGMLQLSFGWSIAECIGRCSIAGAISFIVALVLALHFQAGEIYLAIVPFAAFFLPFAVVCLASYYMFDSRRKKIENYVPDALLYAASFPRGTPMATIIKNLGKSDYEGLADEFTRAHNDIGKGISPASSLHAMKARNKSKVLDRALDLISEGIGSGAGAGTIFRNAAEDLMETNAIIRERASALVVEKYTLLIAGGLIVPCVLGLVVRTVDGLDFAMLAGLEIGMEASERAALLQSASFAAQIYIAEYALIASLFVAFFESDPKKAIIYALVLLPLSIGLYNAMQVF